MRYWTDAYLGRPWLQGRYTCLDLVADVQREQFDRRIDWPAPAETLHARDAQWRRLNRKYAAPVQCAEAVEGDVAHLMSSGYQVGAHHFGVLCVPPGAGPRILHCARDLGTCLHRPEEMAAFGWQMLGYYRPFQRSVEG